MYSNQIDKYDFETLTEQYKFNIKTLKEIIKLADQEQTKSTAKNHQELLIKQNKKHNDDSSFFTQNKNQVKQQTTDRHVLQNAMSVEMDKRAFIQNQNFSSGESHITDTKARPDREFTAAREHKHWVTSSLYNQNANFTKQDNRYTAEHDFYDPFGQHPVQRLSKLIIPNSQRANDY